MRYAAFPSGGRNWFAWKGRQVGFNKRKTDELGGSRFRKGFGWYILRLYLSTTTTQKQKDVTKKVEVKPSLL